MYSLLIVDDEKWVRQGLRFTIDWESEGIEVLGEAADGEEALKVIEERAPDIIITDIKMPRMDGLALLEAVNERKLPAKIVMISGYSDFGYAQQALRCGAFDYVLKPIEETNLLSVIRKCAEELKQERDAHLHMQQMTGYRRESMPLARQRFLETMLRGEPMTARQRQTMWETLDIVLDPERLRVVSVQVYEWGDNACDAGSRSLLRYALSNIAEEIGRGAGLTVGCPLDLHDEADVVLLQSPGEAGGGDPVGAMAAFMDAAFRYLRVKVNVGLSRERDRSLLHVSFQEAVSAGAYAFYHGFGRIFDAVSLPRLDAQTQSVEYAGPSGWVSRLTHAMKLGKESMLQELTEELGHHAELAVSRHSPLMMRRGLASLLRETERRLASALGADHAVAMRIQLPACSLSNLGQELLSALLGMQRMSGELGNRKRVIELALDYIEERFADSISMNGVAERFYLNPSYFSKIFHEETGETFSKYVARLRVERAKQLLKDSALKVYEIAEHVGYNDFRHFAKVFKEHEGITPGQYREIGVR